MSDKGVIAVDLDSTLAVYTSFKSPSHIGKPVPAMLARVKKWLAEGRSVEIFTARLSRQHSPSDRDRAKRAIEAWCLKYIGRKLPVTAEKRADFVEFYDDRAKQVEKNTGRIIGKGNDMPNGMTGAPTAPTAMPEPSEQAMPNGFTCPNCGAQLTVQAEAPTPEPGATGGMPGRGFGGAADSDLIQQGAR